MKVLVVDDEPLARARLNRLLQRQHDCDEVLEAGNGRRAIELCNQFSIDVILMDIRMPVMDGLQAARHLASCEAPPAVIFCTAYNDYALEAFDANAVGYLLKPVNSEKLEQALAKAKKLNRVQLSALLSNEQQAQGEAVRSHIAAKTSRGIELIAIEEIRYFHAEQKYVTVVYVQDGAVKEMLIDDSLKELEDELAATFVRVHRNALAALAYITGLEKASEQVILKLQDIAQGPQVSRRHLTALKKLLQQL
ncbi:MAG: two-component system response regulator AlgR [Oceanicoccus sp.]|jgi:two-component system response regulator AlgR